MIAPASSRAAASPRGHGRQPPPGSPYIDPVARIDALQAGITTALRGKAPPTPGRIHGLRKQLKEMRALLRLFGAAGDPVREAAGKLADALAGARDATAALDALAFIRSHDLPGDLHDSLHTALEGGRSAAQGAATGRDTKAVLRNMVAAWAQHRPPAPAAGVLRNALVRSYRRARRAAPLAGAGKRGSRSAWRQAAPEALHDLRKRVIVLRYQLELARPLAPRRIGGLIDGLQKLRDRLGDVQDLEVLAATAAWAAVPSAAAAPTLKHARRAAIARAHRAFRRLFSARPRAIRHLLATAEASLRDPPTGASGPRLPNASSHA